MKAHIERKSGEVWLTEPDEIQEVLRGAVEEERSARQPFTALERLKQELADTASVVYTLLQRAQTMATSDIVQEIQASLIENANGFEPLKSLALPSCARVCTEYSIVLDTVAKNANYIELTEALLTYLNQMYCWIEPSSCFIKPRAKGWQAVSEFAVYLNALTNPLAFSTFALPAVVFLLVAYILSWLR